MSEATPQSPPPELLERIKHLTEEQQNQVLEVAWREACAKRTETRVPPPWHTSFKKGNKLSGNRKGTRLLRKTLNDMLKRCNAEGISLAELFLSHATDHAMSGNANFFARLVELSEGKSHKEDEARPAELTIRVRPVEALQKKEGEASA